MNILIFCVSLLMANPGFAADEVKVWMSSSAQKNIFSKITKPFEDATGIKIVSGGDSQKVNATTYFKDVVDAKVDAAVISIRWEDWQKTLKKDGVTEDDIKKVTHRVIGRDLIGIFVNPQSGVKQLSSQQIIEVFTGRVKSWKDVGGADIPITILLPKIKKTNTATFENIALNGKNVSGKILETHDYDDSFLTAEKTPGAVAFAPREMEAKGLTALQIPPIGRPTLLITKGKPSEKVFKLSEFIIKEGAKYGIQ